MLRARLAQLHRRAGLCACSVAAIAPTTRAAPTSLRFSTVAPSLPSPAASLAEPKPHSAKAPLAKPPPATPPTGEPHRTDYERLLVALAQSKALAALNVFRRMDLANSPDLAKLSSLHFAAIIRIVAQNVDKALAYMPAKARLSYALQIYDRMLALGIQPTLDTYTVVLRAHSYLGNVPAIESLLAEMAGKGIDTEAADILTPVMIGYTLNGDEVKGREVLAKLVKLDPSVRPYYHLIAAYAMCGNEASMLALFNELKASSHGAGGHVYLQVCIHYSRQSDHARVVAYIDEFKQAGGQPFPKLWEMGLVSANAVGDHQKTLAMIKEIRDKNMWPDSKKLVAEEVVALVASGNHSGAWQAFLKCASSNRVHKRMETAIASMLGPMTTPAAIADLRSTLAASNVQMTRTMITIMSGYGRMGDVASVKALYADIKGTKSRQSDRYENLLNAIVAQAYFQAGDLAGLEAFKSEIGAAASSSLSSSILPTAE